MRKIILIVLFVCAVVGVGQANTQKARNVSDAASGEGNAALLDVLRNEALTGGGSGESDFIIIARLGAADGSRVWNRRRLHNVRRYLIEKGVPGARIVSAEGEPTTGKGTVEVYLAGVLQLTIVCGRRTDLAVDCCGSFPEYYPWYRGRPVLQ